MRRASPLLLLLLQLLRLAGEGAAPTSAVGAAECKFEKDIDYAGGSQGQPTGWPRKVDTKEACCTACAGAVGCAAGVWSPPELQGDCWFKDAKDVKSKGKPHGSKKSFGCTVEDADGDVPGEEGGGGVEFLLAMGALGALYVGGGVAVGRRGESGRLAGGNVLALHPHASSWRQFAGLVTDGVSFVSGKLSPQIQYTPIPQPVGPSSQKSTSSTTSSSKEKSKSSSKKEKKEKSAAKAKKESSKSGKSRRSSKGGGWSSPSDSVVPPPVAGAPETAVERQQRLLKEQTVGPESGVHSSQQRIKVVSMSPVI